MSAIEKLIKIRDKIMDWSVNEALFGSKKTTIRLDKLEKAIQQVIYDLEKDKMKKKGYYSDFQ